MFINKKNTNNFFYIFVSAHLIIWTLIPTITNNVGGLGTTVQHGVSGIVLPAKSDSSAYVREILKLIKNPSRYTELCQNSRKRYEKELKWSSQKANIKRILLSTTNHGGT